MNFLKKPDGSWDWVIIIFVVCILVVLITCDGMLIMLLRGQP